MCDCNVCDKCPLFPEAHTTKEWMELSDAVSVKNKWYVFTDYRTDNDIDIPRFKFGDGVTMISKLPWVTAAVTDNDIDLWDGRALGETPKRGLKSLFAFIGRWRSKRPS